MPLIEHEPMSLFSHMHGELNRFFPDHADSPSLCEDPFLPDGEWIPRIDLKSDTTHYMVTVEVPGVEPGNIQVIRNKGVFTLKGQRKLEKEENGKHHRHNDTFSSFERSFRLPDTADGKKIAVTSKNGVISIQIAKKATAKSEANETGTGA